MKLVIDLSPLNSQPYTGIGIIFKNLIASLAKRKELDLEYFSVSPREFAPVLRKDFPSVKILSLPAKLLNPGLALLQSVDLPLDRIFPDAEAILSIDWLCLPIRRGKTAAILADLTPVSDPQWHTRENIAWFKRRLRAVERNADWVFALSRETAAEITRFSAIPEEKIKIAYPGAPLLFKTQPDQVTLRRIGKKYRLPQNFLLFVGRLDPRKNVANLLKALEIVNRERPLRLVIAGDYGWAVPTRYPKFVQRLDHVEHSDLPSLYRLSQGVVFPSLKEGFGMPIVEAFAARAPLLTSNLSSMKEIAGGAAILVNPYSVEDLARGITKLISLSPATKQALINQGRRRLKLYSFDRMADTIVRTIQEIK